MKEIPSEEMSMLQGGFAPLAPDPPLPGPSGDLEDELRALQDYWNHLLVANHRQIMQILQDHEAQETHGGIGVLESILVGITITAVGAVINNWDSFKAGLMGYPDPAAKKAAQ